MTKDEILGRVPPNAIDIERNIIGAILIEGEKAFTEASLILNKNNEFYKEVHQEIWDTIKNLIDNKIKIDLSVVAQKLRTKGKLEEIGGALYLVELTSGVGSATNIRSHSMLVKQTAIQREIISISEQAKIMAYKGDTDIQDIRDYLDNEISNSFISYNSAITTKVAIENTLIFVKGVMDGTIVNRKLTNTAFDDIFYIVNNELIWLAAAAKAGKTKITTQLMASLLREHNDIAIRWFSMEDPIEDVWSHFGAIETELNLYRILGQDAINKLTNDEYDEFKYGLKKYADKDMEITYGNYSIGQLATEGKQFVQKRKGKFNIIIVDNFNILINGVKGNNSVEKENYVVGKLQDLKTETNKNGFKTLVYVIDHIKKIDDNEAILDGFRLTKSMVKGTSRKLDVLTQLVTLNRPGTSEELMQEERMKGDIKLGKKMFNRAELLEKLTICEVALSRKNSSIGKILKLHFDYGTMQFTEYKDYIQNYNKRVSKIVKAKSKFEKNTKKIELRKDDSSVFDEDVTDAVIVEDIPKVVDEPKLKGAIINIDKKGEILQF